MDPYEREQAIMFFGGTLPPEFEEAFIRKKMFRHSRGIGGPLRGEALEELYWEFRHLWPPGFCDPHPKPKQKFPVVLEPQDKPSLDIELQPESKPRLEDLQEDDLVYAFVNKSIRKGRFKGRWGENEVRIAFNGDDREYRRVPIQDVDLSNGRD